MSQAPIAGQSHSPKRVWLYERLFDIMYGEEGSATPCTNSPPFHATGTVGYGICTSQGKVK